MDKEKFIGKTVKEIRLCNDRAIFVFEDRSTITLQAYPKGTIEEGILKLSGFIKMFPGHAV